MVIAVCCALASAASSVPPEPHGTAFGWAARGGNHFADNVDGEPFHALALAMESRLTPTRYLRIEPEVSLGRRMQYRRSGLVARTYVRGYLGFDVSSLVSLRAGAFLGLAAAERMEVPLGVALAMAFRLGRDQRSELGLFLDGGVSDFRANDAGGFGAAAGVAFAYVWR